MQDVDLNDIQGLIKRGYDNLPYSNILLLRIDEGPKAKKWLQHLLPAISHGGETESGLAINIAFTYAGLGKLGLPAHLCQRFSREFEEGMSDENRNRLLGDYDRVNKVSKVSEWEWRDGEGHHAVHAILLLYGHEENLVEEYCTQLELRRTDNGMESVKKLTTIRIDESKEHFGFRDGISQPFIEEFASSSNKRIKEKVFQNTVQLGEFLLGYRNQYGKYPASPTLRHPLSKEEWDFGKNGTYLVMRQLEQHVKEFWEFMVKNTSKADGGEDIPAAIALASKLVGRWPNGTPLALSPSGENAELSEANDFLYHFDCNEHYGNCPVGAHIARMNPRDALAKQADEALRIANNHRILRRGRSYGRPFITSMQPQALLTKASDEREERGLHFICLNANISRQFEFIQSTWVNNTKFNGLYNDADQLSGASQSDFVIQQRPISLRLKEVPPFVTVKGGGYFFMPSLSALKFLANN